MNSLIVKANVFTELNKFQHFRAQHDLSMETLAERIVVRHQDTIKIKKAHVAIRNLCRILDSALTLSNRIGFHAMSLRELSTHSGVSMGALYTYFDSKETLLAMILHTVADAVEGLRGRRFSSEEITRAHIDAVEAARPLNAYVLETPERALEMARASDARLGAGQGGPLEGAPLGRMASGCF